MEPSWTHQSEITLSQPFGPGARIVFALAGFAVVLLALRGFSDALPVAVNAVFIGLCSFALAYVLLNAFGISDVWTLRERELVLERRTPWLLSTVRFKGQEIAATAIVSKTEKGADGDAAPMFALMVVSTRGRSYQLPPLAGRLKAEALETELRARLGLPSR
jgi:hypothetical protein